MLLVEIRKKSWSRDIKIIKFRVTFENENLIKKAYVFVGSVPAAGIIIIPS